MLWPLAGVLSGEVAGSKCRFGVLGPLVFERGGEPVPVPSGRQRSLLALLLLGGGVALPRDRLIDELWGERPPASAVSALHVHLSKLRGLLDGLLVLDPAGYALEAGSFELDVWQFDALVEQARADPQHAAALLAQALALFRGEPLCDVASEGSAAQWQRALEEKRMQATVMRIDGDLAAGGAGELVAELERLVADHPYEERLSEQLMVALYRAGRQADALEAYQRARRLYASELGLEPGESLTRRHQQILEQDPALNVTGPADVIGPTNVGDCTDPAEARRRPSPPSSASNLPRPLTRLIGRERELAALDELITDPDVRMLTLTGPGGVGKTRLLLELARRHESEYGDGAVLVRLERLTEAALVGAEIASQIALREGTEGPAADDLAGHLRDRELLLAIDNFEHLLDASVLVAELLAGAQGIRVLVSSRTPLRIRGEQTFEVEPLALPAGETEQEISDSPAVQLFLQTALATNRKLEIDSTMTQTVTDICRALDGLPLAIELAASRSRSMSPAQIADQLAEPLSIGEHALRDLPDRQQTLQATIRWSYDLLAPGARAALRAAAVFLGGFTQPAFEAVVGDRAREQLDELLDANLVRRQGDGSRFELLELVRAFALDELLTSETTSEARSRHRRYFAAYVLPTTKAFDEGAAPLELAAPLIADHANLRAALEDAIEAGDVDSVVALALGLRPVWMAGMLRLESQELVNRVLDQVAVPGDAEIALLKAVALLDFSPDAKQWHRRLASRAADLGDQDSVATATCNLFGAALNMRDLDEMALLRPQLRLLVTPDTSPRALGWIEYFLALDAYVDGRHEDACEHAALSAEQAETIGHEFMLASAFGTRLLASSARDGVLAQPVLAEAIELMRRPGVPPLSTFALWFIARYAAGVAPEIAPRWLAHAEQIVSAIDAELWPECVLRDETAAALGLDDLAALPEVAPALDHVAALAEAASWLAERDPAETAPRLVSRALRSAAG